MTPETLKLRTRQLAVAIVRFCRSIPRSEEGRVIGRQLLGSGTSIGANYRAVCRARSDAEFVAKLGLVIEEADETGYWCELLVDAEIARLRVVEALIREADELTRIFVASRETARRRMRARRSQSKIKNQRSKMA
jgi:four helix bundle protein